MAMLSNLSSKMNPISPASLRVYVAQLADTYAEQLLVRSELMKNVPYFTVHFVERLVDADICIAVLWSRLGDFEEEFYALSHVSNPPQLLIYRALKPISPETDVTELGQVQRFWAALESKSQAITRSYRTAQEFEAMLSADISTLVADKHIQRGAEN